MAIVEDMPLEELAFRPVPVLARHDGWTKARQQGFILRLALTGCVAASAKAVDMSPKSAYRLRERAGAESFAASWDKALGWGRDRTLDRSLERAICGESFPVIRDGRVVGERVRYENRLSLVVLNALDRRAPAFDAAEAMAAYRRLTAPDGLTENKGFSDTT